VGVLAGVKESVGDGWGGLMAPALDPCSLNAQVLWGQAAVGAARTTLPGLCCGHRSLLPGQVENKDGVSEIALGSHLCYTSGGESIPEACQ
jgi:hypothetical protein